MPTGKPRLPKMSHAVAAALEHELARLGKTYAQATAGLDPIPDPATLVKLLKLWNDLSPDQRNAWEAAAGREDPGAAGSASTN
jgi:hypothetical protein